MSIIEFRWVIGSVLFIMYILSNDDNDDRNEVLRSALKQYKSLFEAKSKAVFKRRNMLPRTIKLSRGLIKTAMS